jgi:hypothetical protein
VEQHLDLGISGGIQYMRAEIGTSLEYLIVEPYLGSTLRKGYFRGSPMRQIEVVAEHKES